MHCVLDEVQLVRQHVERLVGPVYVCLAALLLDQGQHAEALPAEPLKLVGERPALLLELLVVLLQLLDLLHLVRILHLLVIYLLIQPPNNLIVPLPLTLYLLLQLNGTKFILSRLNNDFLII